MFRRLAIAFTLFLLTITFALAAAYASRIWIAEQIATLVIARQGLGPARLNISRLDLEGLSVDDISLAQNALKIDRVEARYTWRDLRQGRLEKLEAVGTRGNLTWNETGVYLGNFVLFDPEAEGSSPISLPEIAHVQISNAVIELKREQDTLRGAFDIEVINTNDIWDVNLNSISTGLGVTLTADWRGLVHPNDLLRSSGKGSAAFDVSASNVATVLDGVKATGSLDVELANQALEVLISRPIHIEAESLPASLRELLPATAGAISDGNLTVDIVGGERGAFFIQRHEYTSEGRADIQGTATLGPTRLSLALRGNATIDDSGSVQRFTIDTATTEVFDFPLDKALIDAKLQLANIVGPTFDSLSHANLIFTVRNFTIGDARAKQFSGNLTSDIQLENDRLNFHALAGQLQVREAIMGQTMSLPKTTTLRLLPNSRSTPQTASFPLGDQDPSNLEFDVSAAISNIAADFKAADDTHSIHLDIPQVRANGSVPLGEGHPQIRLSIAGGEASHELGKLDKIGIDLLFNDAAISGAADLRLVKAGDIDLQSSAQQLDLRAISTFQVGSGRVSATGGLQARNKTKFADFAIQAAVDGSNGQAKFGIANARLGSGGAIDTAMLSAFLPVTDLGGTLDIGAEFKWNEDSSTHSGKLRLENALLASSLGAVSGLSTTVSLESLWPPRSLEPHHIKADNITVGIPLTNFEAEITWPGNKTAHIEKVKVGVAEGVVSAMNVVVPLDSLTGSFTLDVNAIDVSNLTAMADIDGLTVNGLLSGTIPIQFSPDEIRLSGGKLSSIAPGYVQYRPAQPPPGFESAGGGNLLLQALDNFRYDSLAVTANGDALGELDFSLAFQGRNPALYDGYPIAFNLTLNGQFLEMITQGLAGYRIPDTLQRGLGRK